jgi:hypothetical protein
MQGLLSANGCGSPVGAGRKRSGGMRPSMELRCKQLDTSLLQARSRPLIAFPSWFLPFPACNIPSSCAWRGWKRGSA